MDINKALQRLKKEKKKGVEESTKMAPIPEDPLEKDDQSYGEDKIEVEN